LILGLILSLILSMSKGKVNAGKKEIYLTEHTEVTKRRKSLEEGEVLAKPLRRKESWEPLNDYHRWTPIKER
jgi:hypothetical protein